MNHDQNTYHKNAQPMSSHISVSAGSELSIFGVKVVKDIGSYKDELFFDEALPGDGQRKVVNINRLNDWGWPAKVTLAEGLLKAYMISLVNDVDHCEFRVDTALL